MDASPEKKSFRQHLLRTYLFISGQFVASLVSVLIVLIWLNGQTRYHLAQVGPIVETVNELAKGVNESMLLLDEWLFNATPDIRQERQAIWDGGIYPMIDRLEDHRHGIGREETKRLRQKLQELQTEQWIVEDLAHMQGNEHAVDLYWRKLKKIDKQVFNGITRIIALNSATDVKDQPAGLVVQKITRAANVRGFFSFSNANLIHFILSGNASSEKNFKRNLKTARRNLEHLIRLNLGSGTNTPLLNRLQRLLSQYEHETNEALAARRSPQWNQAVSSYNDILVPLRNELNDELNLLLTGKTAMLHDSSNRLIQLGYAAILVFSVIGAVGAYLIFQRARRDINQAGRLEETILLYTEKMEVLSRTDQLTGLANRRAMEEMLATEIENAGRTQRTVALAYFDIDNFKGINDTLGHVAGDEVLQHIGFAAKNSIRRVDVACRYGGDEFCIIFPGCGCLDAKAVCEKFIEKFNEKYPQVFLSIGITEMTPSGKIGVEAFIKKADAKMYLAKKRKGNHISI